MSLRNQHHSSYNNNNNTLHGKISKSESNIWQKSQQKFIEMESRQRSIGSDDSSGNNSTSNCTTSPVSSDGRIDAAVSLNVDHDDSFVDKRIKLRPNENGNESARRMSTAMSLSGNTPVAQMCNRGFADINHISIPIVGYEIMEERARFTVFKLRIENPFTNDCWLVLRRYTDFVRLHNRVKPFLPIDLHLPRKKLFGNNFSNQFLDDRSKGLQMYINGIIANESLTKLKIIREFFCLDEPPTYSDSVEECRAIFEAQEETIAHLKLQLQDKNDTIETLKQNLAKAIQDRNKLQGAISKVTDNCTKCSIDIDEHLQI